MEALLFTLDVFFLLVLVRMVQLADKDPKRTDDLGFFGFKENKESPPREINK